MQHDCNVVGRLYSRHVRQVPNEQRGGIASSDNVLHGCGRVVGLALITSGAINKADVSIQRNNRKRVPPLANGTVVGCASSSPSVLQEREGGGGRGGGAPITRDSGPVCIFTDPYPPSPRTGTGQKGPRQAGW